MIARIEELALCRYMHIGEIRQRKDKLLKAETSIAVTHRSKVGSCRWLAMLQLELRMSTPAGPIWSGLKVVN